MATACWDFIVAKTTLREGAPMLDFSSLRGANTNINQQVIHICLWMCWGQFSPLHRQMPKATNSPLDMPSSRSREAADSD
jgi:hypothetical protein